MQRQARSQPQNSKGAPAMSKGAHNLHPKGVDTKSPSQPITARGSGERCKLPQRGLAGAEPQSLTISVHFGLKWKLLDWCNNSEYCMFQSVIFQF